MKHTNVPGMTTQRDLASLIARFRAWQPIAGEVFTANQAAEMLERRELSAGVFDSYAPSYLLLTAVTATKPEFSVNTFRIRASCSDVQIGIEGLPELPDNIRSPGGPMLIAKPIPYRFDVSEAPWSPLSCAVETDLDVGLARAVVLRRLSARAEGTLASID